MGHHFQDTVCAFLEKKFGKVANKWKGLPDIQLEVNGVQLNLEVTMSRNGFWYKVLDYKERGVPLHAIIVAVPPTDTTDCNVPILLFDETLPEKLREIGAKS